MDKNQAALIKIAGLAMNGEKLESYDFDLKEVYNLAGKHGIEHILGMVIDHPRLLDVTMAKVQKNVNQVYEAERVVEECEKNGIDILLLKGICTQKRYKVPDVRTMGDIDMLYKKEQNDKLRKIMAELGFEWLGQNIKHDHYMKQPFTCIEMHRDIVDPYSEYLDYYSDFWNKCSLKDGYMHLYEMSKEEEFVFNVVHLAEHFRKGGVGIRLIMDIFVYNNLEMNFELVKQKLESLGLLDFYENISKLSAKWFEGKEVSDETVLKLEDFVLNSGIYGNAENSQNAAIKDSKLKYALTLFFPPLKFMKTGYLYLENHPFLLPFAWVQRFFIVLFKRRREFGIFSKTMIKGNTKAAKELNEFFKECGL